MPRAILLLVCCAALSSAVQGAEWRLLAADPDSVVMQLSDVIDGRIQEGAIQLQAGQAAGLFTAGADGEALLYLSGPAEVEFADAGALVVLRSGTITLFASRPGSLRFRLASGDADVVSGTLPRGTVYVRGAADRLELAIESDDAAALSALRSARPLAPGRTFVWSEGQLADAGEFQLGEDQPSARRLLQRVGINSAREQRLVVQRDLVLNLLAIDTTAKPESLERDLAIGELRVVNSTANQLVIANISNATGQTGILAGAAVGNLRLPGANSPAGLATSAEARNQRPPSSDGRGLGTNGFGILGINFFGAGAGGVVGPGSLVAPGAR